MPIRFRSPLPSRHSHPGLRTAVVLAIALGVLPQPAAPAVPPKPGAKVVIRAIAGVYRKRFENQLANGARVPGEDRLELTPTGDGLHVRIHLEFFNGHLCAFRGHTTAVDADALLVEEEGPPAGSPACTLTLAITADAFTLHDPEGRCRSRCGMRGNLDGVRFRRAWRVRRTPPASP